MTSHATRHFRRLFKKLPLVDQELARTVYNLWLELIDDRSRFGELVSRLKWHSYEGYSERVYTVHVTNKIIALCVKRGDVYIWTYIGEHLRKNERMPPPEDG